MPNANISASKLRYDLKTWICGTPFIHSLISNPFSMAILILTLIWLLDLLYGKTFECASSREVIQHLSTALFTITAGIFLNNLTISKCAIRGGEEEHMDHSIRDKYQDMNDSILSQYE